MGTKLQDWSGFDLASNPLTTATYSAEWESGMVLEVVEDATSDTGRTCLLTSTSNARQFARDTDVPADEADFDFIAQVKSDVGTLTQDKVRFVFVGGGTSSATASGRLATLRRKSGGSTYLTYLRYDNGAGTVLDDLDSLVDWTSYGYLRVRVRGGSNSLRLTFGRDLSDVRDPADPGGDPPIGWLNAANSTSGPMEGAFGIGGQQTDYEGSIGWYGVAWGADDVVPVPDDTVATPAGFTFDATGLQLDGAWSAVSGTTVTYDWEIERDDASTWVAFDSGNTATLAFAVTTGVAYSTTYRARVRTDDDGTKSAWTAYTSATTVADALALSGEQSEAVTLSWTAATGPYDIRRDETTLIAEGLTVTTYTDTDVEAGTSYTYEVREDAGAWSEPVTVAVVEGGGGVFFLKRVGEGWTK